MKMIGGNKTFTIQAMTTTQNDIGEDVNDWTDVFSGVGFLDMMSGDKNSIYSTWMTQSTHVLICDVFNHRALGIGAENHRLITDGDTYEITYIDNPMELNQHMEIYLKFLGGV